MSDSVPFDVTLDHQGRLPSRATDTAADPERIGRYRIQRVLGEGSFGRVYLTDDEQLGRSVAIKVPHAALVGKPEDARIYLEEARAVANLDHPNIVPVYDVGNTDACPCYIVSKYIEGTDLATKLKASSLDHWQAAELVATVAEALHYAHTQGLVHRDVKPGNILLDSDGKPYVVDFGLALSEANIGQGAKYVGTPSYMSPEQARGEGHRVDGRSDIFSLGVVFYELLTDQRPFRADTLKELAQQVVTFETKPPRQVDDTIPRELERICLKAMFKRASERYTTARDMAEDVWQYLATNPAGTATPVDTRRAGLGASFVSTSRIASASNTTSSSNSLSLGSIGHSIKVVPKGLRAFDGHDADFFLELLPGPRDREGLPDSLRFWKTRLEEMDPSKSFAVGLICGPSGCGKSSFVKAGLLPRLSQDVIPVYIEATADETETRLLNGVRRSCPGLPQDLDLKATLTLLRQGHDIAPDRKVALILDQFEQWLHAGRSQDNSELVQSLRQCDGGGVQCILMVRDDFWMAIIRFMRELEVRLLEGENSWAVDLFEPDHARKVLAAFGRAFGRLPENLTDAAREQKDFLNQAVSGLTEEGKVICVRLALFAEMMKSRPWTPASLKQVGGTKGVGATFLDETFSAATASPQHRYHQKAARAILRALLPESGTDIKGHMRSYDELLELSGYTRRPIDFEDLIKILDNEIRLITPTDPAGAEPAGAEPDGATTSGSKAGQKYYQLTHDYLVHSLRDWLTRKQKETRRGRAQINLAERALLWNAKKDSQQLPSIPAWLNIRLLTDKSAWSATERAMLRVAGRYYSARIGIVTLALLVGVLVGAYFWTRAVERSEQLQSDVLVKRLADAQTSEVPRILPDLTPFRRWVNPRLADLATHSETKSKAKLHAALGLLSEDRSQVAFLTDRLRYSTPEELLAIRTVLQPYKDDVVAVLWEKYDADAIDDDERFRMACALAGLDAMNARWSDLGAHMAAQLVNKPLAEVVAWVEALRPIQRSLVDPLCVIFRSDSRAETVQLVAANVLADYARQDVARLSALTLDADSQQFAVLLPRLELNRDEAIKTLAGELAKTPEIKWPAAPLRDWEEPDERIAASLEAADGMVTPDYAIVQTLPLEAFERIAKQLSACGYRPERFRPYEMLSEGVRVAAIWTRDGRDWVSRYEKSAAEIAAEDESLRERGFRPLDVALYDAGAGAGASAQRYAAIWGKDCDEFEDAKMFVGVPTAEHANAYQPLLENGFVPFTDLKDEADGHETLHSSVRWKLKKYPWVITHEADLEDSKSLSANDWYQADVRILKTADGQLKFAGTWWPGMGYETKTSLGLTPGEQRGAFARFRDAGFRPLSITVSSVHGASRLVTASVWRRPTVTEDASNGLAKRQANAALAIARLGNRETLWPLLSLKPDPTLRSHVTNRIRAFGIPLSDIMDRLRFLRDKSGESFASQRRALLIAVSEFDLNQHSPARQTSLCSELESLYRGDPDPGVRAAAEVALKNWLRRDLLEKVDEQLRGKPQQDRDWYVTAAGQTMAVVPSFEEWKMGSPGNEQARIAHTELLHPKLLCRRIAVSTKEITVQQYLQFQPEHDYAREYCAVNDCPINMVSWFDAAKYCRWLSERESIPEDQMCYPPMDKIEPGMRMSADYLRRSGYRLLTEAEWEFLCRAGTTSSRYFGNAPELLPRYAFTAQNSGFVAAPVGSLLPNDFGLFDMLGNAFEWCQDPDRGPYRPRPFGDEQVTDSEDLGQISDDNVRIMRGGSFLYQPSNARSAHRDHQYPTRRAPYLSFRIARTLVD